MRRAFPPGAGALASAALLVAPLFGTPCVAPAGAQYPTTPPPPAPVRPAAFPPFQQATLPNGLRVVLVENHRDPVVAFRLSMPAGDAYAPPGKEGLSDLTATLITRGAGTRTAEQVAAAIEGAGGSLAAASGPDFLTLYGSTLSANTALAMRLAGDAVARPTFAESEVDLARTQELSGLQLAESRPGTLADRAYRAALYGSNPYGRTATPATVRPLTRADVVAYAQARLRPQGALLVVAGDVTMPQLRTLAAQSFGGWSGAPAVAPAMPAPPTRTARGIILVNRPGSVQANILAGNLTAGPADSTRYAASVANKLLGGGADSRLFDVLREKKGWTYGAYSNLTRPRGTGAFTATAEVRTEVADSALTELLAQLARVTTDPVPADELTNAKNALVGQFPLTIETAQGIAEQVAQVQLLGLPSDYLATYRTRLSAVTAPALQAAARAYVRPSEALVVVVGDGAKLYDRLAKLGPVRVVDPQGNAVTAASLTAPATARALPLDPARLVAHRDSFVVRIQGNPLGYSVENVEKTGDGWTVRDDVLIAGGLVRQSTTLVTDARLAPRSLVQTGSQQGQSLAASVTFADGRAKGTASRPGPQGVQPVTVDAAVPAGALDDNALLAAVPALPWAPGKSFTATAFSSGKNALATLTLTVAGTESFTVPAGTFQVYRVDQTGGDQPATFYVTTAAPYRVVRLVTGPIELQLTK